MSLLSAAQYAETILTRAYHRSTAAEMAESLRSELDACSKRTWDEMRPGYTYLHARYAGVSQEVFHLVEFTPSKRQASVVRRTATGELGAKIYRGDYSHSTMIELSVALITMLGISHRDVLETAIEYDLSQDIPGAVRREEPDLFVSIPEQFIAADSNSDPLAHNSKDRGPDRLRNTLAPKWGTPVTPALVEEWIESAHGQIAAYQEEKFAAVRLNPKIAGDYDRYIADAQETIDWYRWVQTTVEPGGVFAIAA